MFKMARNQAAEGSASAASNGKRLLARRQMRRAQNAKWWAAFAWRLSLAVFSRAGVGRHGSTYKFR